MKSDLWLDLSSVGSDAFLSVGAITKFDVSSASGVFYVVATLDSGTTVTVASNFASSDAARAWVLDTIKNANVK
jgi:hypothetical protein